MTVDITRLEEAAKKASAATYYVLANPENAKAWSDRASADLFFEALANPEAILLLIARLREAEKVLGHYAELFCELPHSGGCGKMSDDFCSGCRARAHMEKYHG